MSKYKSRINFYGKDMNLLEAKLFACGLKIGIINITLTDEDLNNYSNWKRIRENRNEISKKLAKEEIYKKLTEKDYLIETLNREIKEAYKKKSDSYEDKNSGESTHNPFQG